MIDTVKAIGISACLYTIIVSLILQVWLAAFGWFVVGVLMFVGFNYIEND